MYILKHNLKRCVTFTILLISILLLSSCSPSSEIYVFKNTFSIDGDDMELTEVYNSYSGAPYEGESLYIVESNSDVTKFFNDFEDLPLSDELQNFFYDELTPSTSKADEIGLPKIESGKWKFVDRGNTTFTENSSYNFSICIYDSENDIIYYYKIDT